MIPPIKISLSENGYVEIDMPGEAADLTGHIRYASSGYESYGLAVAKAIVGHDEVKYLWARPKRGIRNNGWTMTFRDERRLAAFLASRGG